MFITNVSSTLIDVLLTDRHDYFIKSGTFDPEISDHCLIYGILNEKTIHHQPKTIMSRNLKSILIPLNLLQRNWLMPRGRLEKFSMILMTEFIIGMD